MCQATCYTCLCNINAVVLIIVVTCYFSLLYITINNVITVHQCRASGLSLHLSPVLAAQVHGGLSTKKILLENGLHLYSQRLVYFPLFSILVTDLIVILVIAYL